MCFRGKSFLVFFATPARLAVGLGVKKSPPLQKEPRPDSRLREGGSPAANPVTANALGAEIFNTRNIHAGNGLGKPCRKNLS